MIGKINNINKAILLIKRTSVRLSACAPRRPTTESSSRAYGPPLIRGGPLCSKSNLMKTTIIAISLITLLKTIALADVTIIKDLTREIEKGAIIYVDAVNDGYDPSDYFRVGSEEGYIGGEMSAALRDYGFQPNANVKTAQFRLECHFRHGWGLPRIIRHFKIKATYITKVNIKIFENNSDELIGEIYYKRPWAELNPNGFIASLIEQLINSKK